MFRTGHPLYVYDFNRRASTDATEKETTTILSGWIIVQL